MSRVRGFLSVCLTATFAAAAPAVAKAPTLVKGSSGPLAATLTPPPTHTPKVNTKVPIAVNATLKGKPARASALYEFLFAGQVVSTQYVNNNKHFTFTGHYSDTLVFPPSAVGQPLTLRVVIKAGGRTVHLDWAIAAVK